MRREYAIPGYDRYLLVGEGNDWTVLGPGPGIRPEIRKPWLPVRVRLNAEEGRPCLRLSTGDRRRHTIQLGRVVLLALVGPPPPGTECCHGDGDPTNNRIWNLRWDTRRANQLDSVRHGTHVLLRRGEDALGARIPDEVVAKIRAEYVPRGTGKVPGLPRDQVAPGSLRWLADKYGLSKSQVANIVTGKQR